MSWGCEVGSPGLYECMVCVWVVCKREMGVWMVYECGNECHVVEWCACSLIMSFQWLSECALVCRGWMSVMGV